LSFFSPSRWQQRLPFSLIASTIARMSTGVDDQPTPNQHLDQSTSVRQRSFSRSNDSLFAPTVESGRVFDKQAATMAQTQRTRYVKTGAIIAFVFMVLLWLSPSRSTVPSYTQGKYPLGNFSE
jgi:guanosine-diphosphatase